MKNKRQHKELEAINHAIAHLNGYACIVQSRVGYKPLAVDECIESLRQIAERLK